MLRLLRSLLRNKRLLKDFVIRDLKARYVGSSMGFFWSVVFPIINLFVFMFVFRLVLNARWGDKQGATEVALVMLAGIVVWAAFAETVSRATNSLVENANLIQKVVFPSEVLPAYLTVSSLINMCIGLPVVILCVVWFAFVAPPAVAFEESRPVGEDVGAPTAVSVGLSRGHRSDVVVDYTVSGTAVRGVDYEIEPDGPLTIQAGRLSVEVLVTPLSDEDDAEGDETVVLTLGEPSIGSLGEPRTYTVTLADGLAQPPARPPRPTTEPSDYRPLDLGPGLLVLPLLFLLQIAFTTGLGCFLATLNLFVRDTYHLVGVFVTVWMFATPIFYPAEMVERADFGWLLQLNPMHWLIEAYRAVLLYGDWPDWWQLARFTVAGAVFLFLGASFFMAQKHRFPDLL